MAATQPPDKTEGAAAEGVVLNNAAVPGQLVRLIRGVAATPVNTVKVPLLVNAAAGSAHRYAVTACIGLL